MPAIDLEKSPSLSEFARALPACDILMQLDNMLEGGLENVVIALARALEGWGYRVAILVLGATGEGARKALRSGLSVCVFPYNEQVLLRELERSRPAAVFAHYSFQGAYLYERLGIPFIQVLHNVYAWFDSAGKEMFTKAAKHTSLFVAVSDTVKEYSIGHLGVPAEKCVSIPNGIDLSRYTPEAGQEAKLLREQSGFSEKDFLFVAVASINRNKRILTLVKSFRCIRDLAPRARLILLGYPYDKGYLDEILAYISKNNLQDRVSYAGHSTTPELYYLMGDAFVHAAGLEGGQLVLLEALAANLAVATTDVGFARHFAPYPGIRTVDRDFPYTHASFTHTEALCPSPGLVGDLALAMLLTCQAGIRPNLPREVIAAFDASRTYARYEQLIADILKRPPRTEPAAGWMALLPESSIASAPPISPSEKLLADAVRVIAQYEATVAEHDVRIQELPSFRSWRLTALLRALTRFVRFFR
jgi:glycosyltransferase involved in cell wall biosynthesis